MSNAIDIANQIAAASQPLVVAVPTVAVPAVAAPVTLVVAAPVAAVVVPAIDPAALVAEAAADGIVVAGAAPAEAPAPVAAPLTRGEALSKSIAAEQAKIDAATKRRDLLTAQLASIDKITGIVSGSIIVVQLGRAETTRQVRAVVTGVKVDGTSTKFKVLVGEGFDATTEVVSETQVVSVE